MPVETYRTNLPILVMVLGGECGWTFLVVTLSFKVILHTSK